MLLCIIGWIVSACTLERLLAHDAPETRAAVSVLRSDAAPGFLVWNGQADAQLDNFSLCHGDQGYNY